MIKQPITVLAAEDEQIVALDLKKILIKNGLKVSAVVSSGEALIEQYKIQKPDIIISDINLKGNCSGIDAVRILNPTDNTPVIFLTGYGDKKTFEKLQEPYPCAFLIKPFDETELIKLIHECVAKYIIE
jgi:two-component system, response regulator PdtaR